MDKFVTLTGVVAPLPMINVDTDMIIPKQFLKTIRRTGLGRNLFDEMRYRPDGAERPDFVLNRAPYRDARILVAGANFGCGSSREHAPWALLDFGIRCIIAPSFADIFHGNCFKNGILPLALPEPDVEAVMAHARAHAEVEITVDLEHQCIDIPGRDPVAFEIDPFRRRCLLDGLDEIALTLKKADALAAFETRHRAAQPWLFGEVR